jgi:hypothetical protein
VRTNYSADDGETKAGSGRALRSLVESLKNKLSQRNQDSRAFIRDLHHGGIADVAGARSGSHRHPHATGAVNQ